MDMNLMPGILRHIQPLGGFENAKLIKIEEGYCEYSIDITESMLNLYGNVHGGVLFTLCDMAAGMLTYAYGESNVTLSSAINYLKGLNTGTLIIKGEAKHKGKSTCVSQISISDSKGTLIALATMNMFITGKVES